MPGGLGGTFGGNPVACAAAAVVLDTVASPAFRAQADGARPRRSARGWTRLAGRPRLHRRRARPRPDARASSSSPDGAPAPELIAATVAAARERGLLLLSCGLDGNVIRLLPPVSIGDDDLADGLDALEASLREVLGD